METALKAKHLTKIRTAAVLAITSIGWLALALVAGAQGATPTYVWHQNDQGKKILMGTTGEWFCGIRSVKGSFAGADEKVEINTDPQNRWYVTGSSRQSDVQIEAFCFPHNSQASGLHFKTWKQGQDPVDLGPVDGRFCALTSIQGNFAGLGEGVRVSTGELRWSLSGTSQRSGVAAQAACVNMKSRQLAFTHWKNTEGPKRLTPASSSICVLTSKSGQFDGHRERIALSVVDGYWQVGGESDNKPVETTAACVTF